MIFFMNYQFPKTFKNLVFLQFIEYKWFYIPGIISLYFTHYIQSEIPLLASRLGTPDIELKEIILKFVFFALGIILFRTASRVLFFYPARVLQKKMRNDLVSDLENSSPFRFRNRSKGDIFQLLTGDIDQIRALIGFVGLQGANFIIAMVVLVPKLFHLSPYFLLAIIPMILCFLIFSFIVAKNKDFFRLTQEAQGEVQNQIIESYNGKKTITNFHVEESFIEKFSNLSLKEMYYFYRSSLGISLSMPLIALGIGFSFITGAYYIKEMHLKSEVLIAFSGFIFLFMEPFSYLSWVGVVISRSKASYQRLMQLKAQLNTVSEVEANLEALNKNLNSQNVIVNFWDYSLSMDLSDCNLLSVVGKTGCGKSEFLMKLSQALKIKKVENSLVFQDPYIFNDTVLNNIFLGRTPNQSEIDKTLKYIKLLGLDVLSLDGNVLSIEVGENGKKLSGGQAKRLVLLRSLMSQVKILIWDDPFSAIDVILEKEIFKNIIDDLNESKRILIISTHRLTTLKYTDKILFLEKENPNNTIHSTQDVLIKGNPIYEFFKDQVV